MYTLLQAVLMPQRRSAEPWLGKLVHSDSPLLSKDWMCNEYPPVYGLEMQNFDPSYCPQILRGSLLPDPQEHAAGALNAFGTTSAICWRRLYIKIMNHHGGRLARECLAGKPLAKWQEDQLQYGSGKQSCQPPKQSPLMQMATSLAFTGIDV